MKDFLFILSCEKKQCRIDEQFVNKFFNTSLACQWKPEHLFITIKELLFCRELCDNRSMLSYIMSEVFKEKYCYTLFLIFLYNMLHILDLCDEELVAASFGSLLSIGGGLHSHTLEAGTLLQTPSFYSNLFIRP